MPALLRPTNPSSVTYMHAYARLAMLASSSMHVYMHPPFLDSGRQASRRCCDTAALCQLPHKHALRIANPFSACKSCRLAESPCMTGCAELEEAMLSALAESADTAQPQRRPPTSKAVLQSLPVEELSAARLQELGGADVQCCVCRCVLSDWVTSRYTISLDYNT